MRTVSPRVFAKSPQRAAYLSALVGVCIIAACKAATPTATIAPNQQTSTTNIGTRWAFLNSQIVPTRGTKGMVSSTDRVASEIGAEIIRRGGNAIDAAVATHFALAVVNPEAGNIGGGGFMIVRMADGRTAALDFREKAPLAATRHMFLGPDGSSTDRSLVGHLAAGVPGSVAGMWAAHQRFGSLRWHDLVQPAINLAEGLVVHQRLASSLREYETRLRKYRTTARAFLLDGRAPNVGDRLVQADLAETLRRIAIAGRDGFYRGRTASLIAAEMRRGGGIITAGDLARYEAVWREPITFQYRDAPSSRCHRPRREARRSPRSSISSRGTTYAASAISLPITCTSGRKRPSARMPIAMPISAIPISCRNRRRR